MLEMVDEARPDSRDPVCGMEVTTEGRHRETYDGHEYLFCSASCLERFRRAPVEFAIARSGIV